MGYKYEKELMDKGGEFIELLNRKGIQAGITMTRDYMLKLEIIKEENNYGNAIIYYKPSKGSYSLKTHELQDNTTIEEIEQIWEKIHNRHSDKDNGGYHAYVDGSYMNEHVGYGLVILQDNKIIREESGCVDDPEYINSRQVGGEIKAVEKTVAWAEKKGIKNIIIYYDLSNLEKWVSGEYKAKNPMTKNYRDTIRKTDINISWKKVKSHTGNKWNDYADKLAKKGTEKSCCP